MHIYGNCIQVNNSPSKMICFLVNSAISSFSIISFFHCEDFSYNLVFFSWHFTGLSTCSDIMDDISEYRT